MLPHIHVTCYDSRHNYKFGTDFELDMKRAVFQTVPPGQEFATPGFWFRLAVYYAAFVYLQLRWIFDEPSRQLAVTMGVFTAFVGLNVFHDANHGAISKRRPWVNGLWGVLSSDLIGRSRWIWMSQHWCVGNK